MVRNIFFGALIFYLCGLTFAEEATEVPPIPESYTDELAVKTAILLGQIKLIDAGNVSTPGNIEEILNIEYGR